MEILENKTIQLNLNYIKVKFKNKIYEMYLYFNEQKEEYNFYYKNGNKPNDIDFEYNILCNL